MELLDPYEQPRSPCHHSCQHRRQLDCDDQIALRGPSHDGDCNNVHVRTKRGSLNTRTRTPGVYTAPGIALLGRNDGINHLLAYHILSGHIDGDFRSHIQGSVTHGSAGHPGSEARVFPHTSESGKPSVPANNSRIGKRPPVQRAMGPADESTDSH